MKNLLEFFELNTFQHNLPKCRKQVKVEDATAHDIQRFDVVFKKACKIVSKLLYPTDSEGFNISTVKGSELDLQGFCSSDLLKAFSATA